MNAYRARGRRDALLKYAAATATPFKPVAPQPVAPPKPANTTGSQLPTVPKPPAGPAASLQPTAGPQEPGGVAPDMYTIHGGMPPQNAVAHAQQAIAKSASDEISPDNGQSLYRVNRDGASPSINGVSQAFQGHDARVMTDSGGVVDPIVPPGTVEV